MAFVYKTIPIVPVLITKIPHAIKRLIPITVFAPKTLNFAPKC